MSDDKITIEVGNAFRSLDTNQVPPIGTHIIVHKHLTEDGTGTTVEVTGHEWRMIDSNIDGNAFMQISVRTKIVS